MKILFRPRSTSLKTISSRMIKNYYDILELPSYEDSQDVILSSYKNGTKKLRDTIFDKADVENMLVLLNEAFLVLSDTELKRLYDYCLSSNSENSDLTEAILSKRAKAKSFIQSKLANAPKKKKRSKWPAILCGFFLLSALGSISKMCVRALLESSSAPYEERGHFYPDSGWSRYEIANSFSIYIPQTMELRQDSAQYTMSLKDNYFAINCADAVFQQAGLSNLSSEAFNTYCRVIIERYSFSPGEVERHDQTSYITAEDKNNLKEIVDAELGPYSYVEMPSYQWISIGGTKAVEAKYRRSGKNGPTVCRLYLLSNYNEAVKMIVSYREADANYWKTDMANIVRTFKWNNPH